MALAPAARTAGRGLAGGRGRSAAQFRDSMAAVALRLDPEERARLDTVSALPVLYPTGINTPRPGRGSAPPTGIFDRGPIED